MNIDLSGRASIVTGAGQGIGKVIAQTLAEQDMVAVVKSQQGCVPCDDGVCHVGQGHSERVELCSTRP
jgi:NAD(P)-dependent dehydrogenase (short-subunit alcohol dehydrogenase family)